MRERILAAAATLLAALLPASAVPPPATAPPSSGATPVAEWTPARPGYPWAFPADHWSHPAYRIEWWYFTGHLADDSGARYGYQLTFFRVGLTPGEPQADSLWAAPGLLMGHAAISMLDGGGYLHSEVLHRQVPFLARFEAPPGPGIVWSRAPAGTDGVWRLDAAGEGFTFQARDDRIGLEIDLEVVPERPVTLHGPGGFSRKGNAPGAASLYYSFTRMRTSGSLGIGGVRRRVTGTSWMDREMSSSQLQAHQVGWDWFSLQLDDDDDDGRDLMLYLLRDAAGNVDFARGTLVSRDGTSVDLRSRDFALEATAHRVSPETGIRYPARWRVRIPGQGIDIEVIPEIPDQEFRSRVGPVYWEGAVRAVDAQGRSAGRGYVELTGYGRGNRPPV